MNFSDCNANWVTSAIIKMKMKKHVWDDNAVCVHCGRDGEDEYFRWVRWLGADECPGKKQPKPEEKEQKDA